MEKNNFMSNKYGIPEEDEKEIRARDKTCIYCHKAMKKYPNTKGTPGDKATIEHLNNDGPFDEKSNLAICCGNCNSSRNNKELLVWFKTQYCMDRNINEKTVAEPVRVYIRYIEGFINRCVWIFAKTMPEIPHYYILKDDLSEYDKKLFDEFDMFIKKNGYNKKFYSKQYTYFNTGNCRYWIIGNILNRTALEHKN